MIKRWRRKRKGFDPKHEITKDWKGICRNPAYSTVDLFWRCAHILSSYCLASEYYKSILFWSTVENEKNSQQNKDSTKDMKHFQINTFSTKYWKGICRNPAFGTLDLFWRCAHILSSYCLASKYYKSILFLIKDWKGKNSQQNKDSTKSMNVEDAAYSTLDLLFGGVPTF